MFFVFLLFCVIFINTTAFSPTNNVWRVQSAIRRQPLRSTVISPPKVDRTGTKKGTQKKPAEPDFLFKGRLNEAINFVLFFFPPFLTIRFCILFLLFTHIICQNHGIFKRNSKNTVTTVSTTWFCTTILSIKGCTCNNAWWRFYRLQVPIQSMPPSILCFFCDTITILTIHFFASSMILFPRKSSRRRDAMCP